MCRRNWFRGWLAVSFGVGVLLGTMVESGFVLFVLGILAVCWGFCLLQK